MIDIQPKVDGLGLVLKKQYTGMEIMNQPSFLSPSSVMQLRSNPNRFFLERMAIWPKTKEPQSLPAAVGSAFDAYCKLYIADKYNIDLKTKLIDAMWDADSRSYYINHDVSKIILHTNIEPDNREEATPIGKHLFSKYKIAAVDTITFTDIEIKKQFKINNVPVLGILDAVIIDDKTKLNIPFDWKVSGYGSTSGVSPKPGYYCSWDKTGSKGPHKKYYEDMPFDSIDDKWALQGCLYGWEIGLPYGEPFPFVIDGIFLRSHSYKIARYRGIITPEFQAYVAKIFIDAWEEIKSGKILDRIGCTRLYSEVLALNEKWWM